MTIAEIAVKRPEIGCVEDGIYMNGNVTVAIYSRYVSLSIDFGADDWSYVPLNPVQASMLAKALLEAAQKLLPPGE
jgi:hypothetical protein